MARLGTPRHALACPRQPPPLPATKIQESLDASFDWPGVRKMQAQGARSVARPRVHCLSRGSTAATSPWMRTVGEEEGGAVVPCLTSLTTPSDTLSCTPMTPPRSLRQPWKAAC